MAGDVRQPIDIDSLSRYIEQNVTDISLPLKVEQASHSATSGSKADTSAVWLWSIKPDLPPHW